MTKTLDDLVTSIAELNAADFLKLLNQLKDLEPLQVLLDTVPEPDRTMTLEKLITFAQNDIKPLNRSTTSPYHYAPPYSRFDLVNCYFTGIGYEWDAKHIALVWDVYPQLDSVMVIPTTSKTRTESKNVFSVNSIPGLRGGKETTLLISDMTRVSRKRIEPLDPYRHPKKGLVPIRLPASWADRILSGIVSTYAGEFTFEEFLKFKAGAAMVSDLRILKEKRFYAIRGKVDPVSNILHYHAWNKVDQQQIQLIMPRFTIMKEIKMKLIDDLFSDIEQVRVHAEAHYYDWYHYKKSEKSPTP
ncbi:hypothetical protein BSK66_31875 [Paenibacillus odorifer]|uniref:hypothetical protein n=1 Tax=Paenibacillus TaxID=44249 RepID=UPI0003E2182B|nr:MULTISPECIES: hypothetical protein [Paenibacillus]ETT61037.1 hypothetical protein C171_13495 [Paenibacillus sp. FSL H8-237]OMD13710.1 hypothetical protein BJP47_24080 [Paenibacillus odorifer]OME46568.1 hypothetical protein BSK66_31875 [Paenibacillus odorifer]